MCYLEFLIRCTEGLLILSLGENNLMHFNINVFVIVQDISVTSMGQNSRDKN